MMKRKSELKQWMAMLLTAALLVLPLPVEKANAAASYSASAANAYNYFNDVYPHLNDNQHVYQTATYEDIVHLFESEGNYAVLIGGAWSEQTQANIGFINEVAKEYGVATIYNFDTKLDGDTLQIADSSNPYAFKYVDLVNKYLTNLDLYDKNDPDHNVSYIKDGNPVVANRLEAPFLFIYNKDHKDGSGNSAPIVAYSDEAHVWDDFLTNGIVDPAKTEAYKASLRPVFSSIAQFDTIDESAYIKAAFNKNYGNENPGKPLIFDDLDGDLVLEHVTYHELNKLLGSEGSYIFLFGGSWCPNTQAAIKYINQYAKSYNISKVYFWDTKLDSGVTVASPTNNPTTNPHNTETLQVRANNHPYAKLYVDVVNKYLTNIKTQNNTAANPSTISYTNENGTVVVGDRLQVPYLFTYNKNNKDADGASAPILGHVELMYSWTNIQPDYASSGYAIGARYTYYTHALDSLFSRVEAVPTGLEATAPTSASNNDGKITGIKNKTLEYKLDGASAYTPASGEAIANLAPGTYNVRYAAKAGYQGPTTAAAGATAILYNAGESVNVIVPAFSQEQAAPTGLLGVAPTTPANDDGKITGTVPGQEYKLAGVTDYVYAPNQEITGLLPGIYQVRFAAVDGGLASAAASVEVPAYGEQAAPTGLVGIAPTSAANNDGRITGTTPALQYKQAGVTDYVYAPDVEISGLTPGIYQVRYAEKEGFNASAATDVVVPAFTPAPSSGGGGSGSGGGTGSSGGSTPNPAAGGSTEPDTAESSTVVTSASAVAVNDNATGVTTATLSAASLASLAEASKKAEAEGKTAIVEIKVAATAETKTAELILPRSALNQVSSDTNAVVRIVYANVGTIIFDAAALKSITSASDSGDISIRIAKVSLTEEGKAVLGDRPVYDLSVKAGDSPISEFGGGKAAISTPYSLLTGEDPLAVIVYHINGSGQLENVRGKYNAATGTVDFVTTHFSQYIIGYNKVTFTDVPATAWYSDAVGFLAARSITTGTDGALFSPNAAVTRGQFIVLLLNAFGIAPDSPAADNFADAGSTYYTGYLAAAKRLGITTGVGDNQFKPDNQITRQELFTLLYRSLDKLGELGELPEGNASTSLSRFNDANQIAGYAQEAIQKLADQQIITGSGGKINPETVSSRAQVAQVLYNLLSKN